MNLTAVPTLAEIATHPERIGDLRPEVIAALRGELARVDSLLLAQLTTPRNGRASLQDFSTLSGQYETMGSKQLAARWNVPETWVRDCVRARSGDPIPCVRLGRYVRFEWGSPQLEAWFDRHRQGGQKAGPDRGTKGRKTHLTQP